MNAESSERIAGDRSEDSRLLGGSEHERVDTEARSSRRIRLLVWAGLTVAFVLFLVVGSVTVHTGNRRSQSARVTQVWSAKADTLPDVGQPTLLQFCFLAAVTLFILSAIAGFGIMLEGGTSSHSAHPDPDGEGNPSDGQVSGPSDG